MIELEKTEDGSLKKGNMHYCIYHWANVFDDTCEDCLVRCEGANKQPFDPKSDYMI